MKNKTPGIGSLAASVALTLGVGHAAVAQPVENGDFRIRAKFRTAMNAAWAPDQSVGNATFRIKSRFLQVYYGGVSRSDDFRFKVQLDFTTASGFATQYATSPFNSDFDVYINSGFVGRVLKNNIAFGISQLDYDSRNPTPPATLLPDGFPDPVNTFDVVSLFPAAASLPAIGDPLPAGAPVFQSELIEQFARGDVNQDGKVDDQDFPFLVSNYDPFHLVPGDNIGPIAGDFTGDNRSDHTDYTLFITNWTSSATPPAEPVAIAFKFGDLDQDGVVGGGDLSVALSAWGACAPGVACASDLNGDGVTNGMDLSYLLNAWGT